MNPVTLAIAAAMLGLGYSSVAIYNRSNKGDNSYIMPLIAAAVVVVLLLVGIHYE